MSDFRVCVYCGSSRQCDAVYLEAAERLGRELAKNEATIIYGGGAVGSMGALAAGALAEGGKVIGVIPRFMEKLEWGHKGITELRVVGDIHERKRLMIQDAHAVVALPGGSGTFDELLEAVSLKRLALFLGPIVVLNTRSYFDDLLRALERVRFRTLHGPPASIHVVSRERAGGGAARHPLRPALGFLEPRLRRDLICP